MVKKLVAALPEGEAAKSATDKILDKNGVEVPRSDYVLDINGDEFTFKFKKPHRSRSGKYTLVFSLDGTDTEKDINVNFIGESTKNKHKLEIFPFPTF